MNSLLMRSLVDDGVRGSERKRMEDDSVRKRIRGRVGSEGNRGKDRVEG